MDDIQVCDAFIIKLLKIEDAEEKKQFLTRSDASQEFFTCFVDLAKLGDQIQIERIIDEITDQFPRRKTYIRDLLEERIKIELRNIARKQGGAFTSADLSNMMNNKGKILWTTSNVINILLGAHNIRLVLDTMTEQSYFVEMPWPSLTREFKLPLMINGNTHIYYPYDNVNRTELKKALNDNMFRDEKHWSGIDDIVEDVAHHEKIDMYQEWMLSLPPWDGIDRITDTNTNWVVRYLKAMPGLWSAAWARMLPLSQVWRCFQPGCQQRYYFAIEGEQNIGKTSFCKALLPANPYDLDNPYWYVSTSIKNLDKDFQQIIAPGAILEFPDLDMNRFNLNDWKRLITETTIVFRAPYGRLVENHPKRSISIITTNDHRYFRDPTGETRAIPIKSLLAKNTFIDHKAFRNEYPQILSQIKEQYYMKGIKPYLTDEELSLQQEEIVVRDAVHEWLEWEHIESMIELNPQYETEITIKDIVEYVCKAQSVSELQINQNMRNRYGQVLRKMGYEPKRKNIANKTTVVYSK
jgi:predicted P-loop ATPase